MKKFRIIIALILCVFIFNSVTVFATTENNTIILPDCNCNAAADYMHVNTCPRFLPSLTNEQAYLIWQSLTDFEKESAQYWVTDEQKAYFASQEGNAVMPVNVENDFSSDIGKTATFNLACGYTSFPISDSPNEINWTTDYQLFTSDFTEGLEVVIVDYSCYTNADSTILWYKVEAAPGYTLPEKLVTYPWVYQNYVSSLGNGYDSLILADSGGSGEHVQNLISSSELPSGSNVAFNDLTDSLDIPTSRIYDIKVFNSDGAEWQPIDEGKTVTLSLPVMGVEDGELVDVLHFIDYAPDINGDEHVISVEGADAETLALLHPAIDAYGDGKNVAIEYIEGLVVTNGRISFETDSFSIYEIQDGSFKPAANQSGEVYFDNSNGAKDAYYYASSNTDFTLFTNNVVLFDLVDGEFYKLNNAEDYIKDNVSLTNNGIVWLRAKATFQIGDLPVGTVVSITFKNHYSNTIHIIIVEEITITYDLNTTDENILKNVTVPAEQTIATDGTIPSILAGFEKEPSGYSFAGWNTSPAGDGTTYKKGDVVVFAKDTTLYAMWNKNKYTIKYDLNYDGAVNNIEAQIKEHDVALNLYEIVPTRDGYIFIGWCPLADGSGTIYQPNEEFSGNADATLYAIWIPASTSLTIKKEGALDIDKNQTFVFVVKGNDDNTSDIDLTVAVHGNGIVNITELPIGSYTITELINWSWRYKGSPTWVFGTVNGSGDASIMLTADPNLITFKNTRSEQYWLDGDCWCDNRFVAATVN